MESIFKNLESGKIGLITQSDDGIIKQIGLTQDQSDMLQAFLSAISKDKPLVFMPDEYDLRLKIE